MRKKEIVLSLTAVTMGCIGFSQIAAAESLNQPGWLFNEPYRNQYHYTAQNDWLNDPNGLVYDDSTGIYHMFYQCNPTDNVWGNLSWGHATSKDMVNWQEQDIAIPQLENQEWVDFTYTNTTGNLADYGEVRYVGKPTTNWGDGGENGKKYVFSGSAVIDHENVTGLGENTILAYYTTCYQVATRKNDGGEGGWGSWIGFNEVQEQHLAYSVDGGETFVQYSPDGQSDQPQPIIPVTQMPAGDAKDFRDPKVVYDEGYQRWLMIVVAGQEAQIFTSENLLDWNYASSITREHDYGVGVWECPELIPMKVEGTAETKWVLTMSVQDNAYASGSGMQYMVGDMNDQGVWIPESDATLKDPVWMDFGEDFYAGVTFNNAPENRKVMLAWMSNWKYVDEQQTNPWYSHMTLPRELTLHIKDGFYDGYELRQEPIKELQNIEEASFQLETEAGFELNNQETKVTNYNGKNYKIEAEFSWEDTNKPNYIGMSLRATEDLSRKIYVGYDLMNELAYVNRLTTGEPNIGGPTRDRMNTKVIANENKIKLTAYVDESAIEVFVNDNERTISQVFYFRPENIGEVRTDSLAFYAEGGTATITSAKLTPLRSIFGDISLAPVQLEIEQGAFFDPLAAIAVSNTSGDGTISSITESISVKENNVDPMLPAEYQVVLGITNSLGKYQEETIPVVVKEKAVTEVEKIELNASGIKILKNGKTFQLSPTFTPANASSNITWSLSNSDIATIDENGELKAKKVGTTKVTAKTENNKKASFTLRVTK